jgi:hypothetical protein
MHAQAHRALVRRRDRHRALETRGGSIREAHEGVVGEQAGLDDDSVAGERIANYCRPCRAAYHDEHYQKNRARYIANAAARRKSVLEERMQFVVAYLREHPCVDCGEDDVVVLEFDHLKDKLFEITRGIRERNWDDVLAEMAKCEVVCANCHRRRTAQRGGYLRAAVAQR